MRSGIKVKKLVVLVADEQHADTTWSDNFMSVRNTEEYKKIESEIETQKKRDQSVNDEISRINFIKKIIEHETRLYKKYLGETDPNAPKSAPKRESNSRLNPWYIRFKERFF